MSLWQSIQKIFTQPVAKKQPAPAAVPLEAELEMETGEPAELATVQVQQALAGDQPPLLLDVREQYEWEQVRIPAALHIPMNEVPRRLGELPHTQPIVVFCAHGSRSYGVASYLLDQGFDAANLRGGITQWRIHGGVVQTGRQ